MDEQKHQIRLSGDPDFQNRLRRLRAALCRLRINEGRLGEVAAFALDAANAQDIAEMINGGCSPANAPCAKAPHPSSLEVAGATAMRLHELRGEIIGLGEHRLNMRAIVHGAICVLSDKSDDELLASAVKQRAEC